MNPKIILDMAKNLGGGKGSEIELPAPQGLFDRFVNGVNRLGRPLLLIGVILFFAWGIMDPVGFVTVMEAFGKTPEWITTAVLLVISIFGTGRVISDIKKKQTMKVPPPVDPVPTPAVKPEGKPSDRRFDNLEEDDDDDIDDLPEENETIEKWKSANPKSS